MLNHGTTTSDVERVAGWLETAAFPGTADATPPRAGPAVQAIKTADVGVGWPGPVGADVDELRSQPLLADIEDERLHWVASVARRRVVSAGETVVRQWEVDRDFYLLLEGDADVFSLGRLLRPCRPGTSSVSWPRWTGGPASATRGWPRSGRARTWFLLVLTDAELSRLMAAAPAVDRRIRAAAAERASRL